MTSPTTKELLKLLGRSTGRRRKNRIWKWLEGREPAHEEVLKNFAKHCPKIRKELLEISEQNKRHK